MPTLSYADFSLSPSNFPISTSDCDENNQLIGYAFEHTSDPSLLLSNAGDGLMVNGLFSIAPVDKIVLENSDVIDYEFFYSEGLNDFTNGNSRGGLNIRAFTSLNTDTPFIIMFISYLNLPDLNRDGTAYNVQFGFNRLDGVGQVWLNLNQDDIFDHGLGASAPYFSSVNSDLMQQGDMLRQCYWGTSEGDCNVNAILRPGKYLFMVLHSVAGVVGVLKPTINLLPDSVGARLVQANDSDRPNLFSTCGIDEALPSSTGW